MTLKLSEKQIANHLAAGDVARGPQRRNVESAGKAVGKAKEHHWGNPATGILEGKAIVRHTVLLDVAAVQVMDIARTVDLGLEFARHVGPLFASQDVEIVIGSVAAAVALGADGSAWCGK